MDWKVVGIKSDVTGASTMSEVSAQTKTDLKWWVTSYKAYDCRIADLTADATSETWFTAQVGKAIPACAAL